MVIAELHTTQLNSGSASAVHAPVQCSVTQVALVKSVAVAPPAVAPPRAQSVRQQEHSAMQQ